MPHLFGLVPVRSCVLLWPCPTYPTRLMASLITRPRSPYWYLQHKKDGKWLKTSTGLRCDCPNDTAKARALRAEFEAAEFSTVSAKASNWEWVPDYLENMGSAPRTLICYHSRWRWVGMFLTHHKITPGNLVYLHAEKYMEWRTAMKKRRSKKPTSRNTAIGEIHFMAFLMGEAVRRGLATANPLATIRLKKTPPKKKPELTDKEIDTCLDALKSEPTWMLRAFLIALHTGCRLRETVMRMDTIDLANTPAIMTWASPKGGVKRSFSVPIPDALIPLFREMKEQGEEFTLTMPVRASLEFTRVFRKAGVGHLTFHCLRVTRITRLRREGVPREVAMRLVNHSSELIHTLYDRHQVQDLMQYRNSGAPSSFAAI